MSVPSDAMQGGRGRWVRRLIGAMVLLAVLVGAAPARSAPGDVHVYFADEAALAPDGVHLMLKQVTVVEGGTSSVAWVPAPPTCEFRRYDVGAAHRRTPPAGAIDGTNGRWYVKVCSAGIPPFGTVDIWVWDDPVEPTVTVEMVVAALDLHLDTFATSPARDQLVGVALFVWVPAELWVDRTQSVALGGFTIAATASPVRTDWVIGDRSLRCEGPGRPFTPGLRPAAGCATSFREASASTALTLRVRWRVTLDWSDGRHDVVEVAGPPATRTFAVRDAQAVVG